MFTTCLEIKNYYKAFGGGGALIWSIPWVLRTWNWYFRSLKSFYSFLLPLSASENHSSASLSYSLLIFPPLSLSLSSFIHSFPFFRYLQTDTHTSAPLVLQYHPLPCGSVTMSSSLVKTQDEQVLANDFHDLSIKDLVLIFLPST